MPRNSACPCRQRPCTTPSVVRTFGCSATTTPSPRSDSRVGVSFAAGRAIFGMTEDVATAEEILTWSGLINPTINPVDKR
ncbi:hypothetical protein GCM10022247_05510 [Allokutzneria multivorans]|uniref:Uncharacterized protein n=1 Tax=Allokutzneria multivorans TaxID=1142134 RepID=A0ABP7R069_9PSEU